MKDHSCPQSLRYACMPAFPENALKAYAAGQCPRVLSSKLNLCGRLLLRCQLAEALSETLLASQESGIPVPHHICVNRDGLPEGQDPEGFIETEDYVEVDGEQFSPSLCFLRHPMH